MLQTVSGVTRSRVSPMVPVAALLAGAAAAAGWRVAIGVGVAAGGLLAYVNGLLLSRRVDLAAATGNMAGALLIMQAGLLLSLTFMAIATVILARYSVATAVSEAAAFGAAHLAILAAYYWTQARDGEGSAGRAPAPETET